MIDEDTLQVGDILYDFLSTEYVLITHVKDSRVGDNHRGIVISQIPRKGFFHITIFSYRLRDGEFRRTTDQEKAMVLLKLEFHGIEIPR